MVLPPWAAETLALWALHTYAFQLRDISAYLGLESPEKRCGKSTLLAVLGRLVHRPVIAANISPPAFFRVIQETRPTLLIDEADTFLQGNDELRGILNSGYSRQTAYVVRVVPGFPAAPARVPNRLSRSDAPSGAMGLAAFSCWCPKIMATIGRLPDTLADRCILIRMHRKLAGEACQRAGSLDATDLKRQCVRFVRDHAEKITSARPSIPSNLNDRAADIWEPLLVLADLAGGSWPERARQAAVALSALAQNHHPIGALLLDILAVFVNSKQDRLFSRTLVDGLNTQVDRPWTDLRRGKAITELWLARLLRPYGVLPRMLWLDNGQARGYCLEDFTEVFRRYIPKSEIEALKTPLPAAPETPHGS